MRKHVRRRASSALVAAAALLAAACGDGKNTVTKAAVAPPRAPAPTTTTAPPVAPLTGLPIDPAGAARPALSVKVDNTSAGQPQSGLNDADLVTEALVEGGLTRLLATFQSKGTALVGPIRSARPVDADLLRQLNGGYFAYSGAAPGEIAPVKDHSNAVLVCEDCGSAGFQRVPSRRAPFNVYSSTDSLYRAGAAQNRAVPAPPALFNFGPVAATAAPATSVTFALSGVSSAAWQWDGHQYRRTQNGRPDVLADGSPVVADNVVVMSVGIRGTGIFDQAHNEDPLVVVIGSGTAWVYRDGTVTTGRWTRSTTTAVTAFTDGAGQSLQLHTGRTWLELLPEPNQPAWR